MKKRVGGELGPIFVDLNWFKLLEGKKAGYEYCQSMQLLQWQMHGISHEKHWNYCSNLPNSVYKGVATDLDHYYTARVSYANEKG